MALLFPPDTPDYRRLLQACLDHADCSVVCILPSNLYLLDDLKPDVLICRVQTERLYGDLKAWGGHVVNLSGVLGDLPFPGVCFDDEEIGRMAAAFLWGKGYRSFAWAGTHTLYARKRLRGCNAFLVTHRIDPILLDEDVVHAPVDDRQDSVWSWLDALPDPCAILTDTDLTAHYIAEVARFKGWNLPSRVGLMSCHDSGYPNKPALTSVRLPEEEQAMHAVRMALRLVEGKPVQPFRVELAPIGVVERESTSCVQTSDPDLRKALEFIAAHEDQPIAVEDVVNATELGRRALERRFFQSGLGGILASIHHGHLRRAKKLLQDPELTLLDVAHASGLSDERHMRQLFLRYEGETPKDYRQRFPASRGDV